MIDPTDPRPASSIPTVDPQHQQADCQPIVEPSILNAQRALADAPPDDDAQWIAIVLASLSSRSCQAKEALLKALAHDRSRVKPAGSTTMTETTESLHEQNRVHPSRSGRAIFLEYAENKRFLPLRGISFPTALLHDPSYNLELTTGNGSEKQGDGSSSILCVAQIYL
jgi:hypothetical protein